MSNDGIRSVNRVSPHSPHSRRGLMPIRGWVRAWIIASLVGPLPLVALVTLRAASMHPDKILGVVLLTLFVGTLIAAMQAIIWAFLSAGLARVRRQDSIPAATIVGFLVAGTPWFAKAIDNHLAHWPSLAIGFGWEDALLPVVIGLSGALAAFIAIRKALVAQSVSKAH